MDGLSPDNREHGAEIGRSFDHAVHRIFAEGHQIRQVASREDPARFNRFDRFKRARCWPIPASHRAFWTTMAVHRDRRARVPSIRHRTKQRRAPRPATVDESDELRVQGFAVDFAGLDAVTSRHELMYAALTITKLAQSVGQVLTPRLGAQSA